MTHSQLSAIFGIALTLVFASVTPVVEGKVCTNHETSLRLSALRQKMGSSFKRGTAKPLPSVTLAYAKRIGSLRLSHSLGEGNQGEMFRVEFDDGKVKLLKTLVAAENVAKVANAFSWVETPQPDIERFSFLKAEGFDPIRSVIRYPDARGWDVSDAYYAAKMRDPDLASWLVQGYNQRLLNLKSDLESKGWKTRDPVNSKNLDRFQYLYFYPPAKETATFMLKPDNVIINLDTGMMTVIDPW